MSELKDGDLLRVFHETADQEAFSELMGRHASMVLAAARSVLGDTHGAEDVVQSTFLTLARKAGSLKRADSLAGWLCHVAICVARDARKKERRRRDREKEAAVIAADKPPTLSHTDRATLYEEIGNLPSAYRAPVVLHHLEGKSYEDAAAELGMNPNAFGVRLTRARSTLRKHLAGRGVVLGAAALAAVLAKSAKAADLPATVIASTCKAASLMMAGKAVAYGIVSARAAAMTQGAIDMLFWMKVKMATSVCVLLIVAGVSVPLGMALANGGGTSDGRPLSTRGAAAEKAKKGQALTEAGVARSGLRLILKMDQKRLSGGADWTGTLYVENVSGKSIRFCNYTVPMCKLVDAAGKNARVLQAGSRKEHTKEELMRSIVPIPPGKKRQICTFVWRDDRGSCFGFPQEGGYAWKLSPGENRLRVSLSESGAFLRRMGIDATLWKGVLTSNEVTVNVLGESTGTTVAEGPGGDSTRPMGNEAARADEDKGQANALKAALAVPITVSWEEVPFDEAMKELSALLKVPIEIDGSFVMPKTKLTLTVEKMEGKNVLQWMSMIVPFTFTPNHERNVILVETEQ